MMMVVVVLVTVVMNVVMIVVVMMVIMMVIGKDEGHGDFNDGVAVWIITCLAKSRLPTIINSNER